jgi:hypothetical protein
MIIKVKGKEDLLLPTIDDFRDYLDNNVDNINKNYLLNSELINNFYYNNPYIIGIKRFRKMYMELFYNVTRFNINYWTTRGWSDEESKNKINEIQSENSIKSKEYFLRLKKENLFEWKSKKSNNVEFYLKRGYSEEESKSLVKERQSTFTLKKCIQKYGEVDGHKRWVERQTKWRESIGNRKFNHDSNSLEYLKSTYGDNYILDAIGKSSFSNREFVRDSIIYSNNNPIKFVDYIFNNKNIYSVAEIMPFVNSKLLRDYFNININDFKNLFTNKFGIIPTRFGNIRYFNGHICRSNGEYYIAKKLKELNIDYIYEKKYPGKNIICDFYIQKYDLYVEYMGFVNKKFIHEFNKELCDNYIIKYESKKKYCLEKNINFLFENDYKILVNKIENYGRNN